MTASDRAIATFLRSRIADVRLDDVRAVVRLLNEMEESLGLSVAGATRSPLRAATEEGAPQLVKELAKGQSRSTSLEAIAAALALKRHLSPTAAAAAVRIWAAALDVAELPADANSTPIGGRVAPGGDGVQVMNTFWKILLALIVAATAVAIGYCCFRETIVEGARRIAWAIVTVPVLLILRELGLALVASWPVRKLWEGVCQIAWFFDRIPGAVYVIVLALGICDALQWLPYGVRDVAAQLPKRTRQTDAPPPLPSSDNERTVHPVPPLIATPTPHSSPPRFAAPVRALPSQAPTPLAASDEVKKPNPPVFQRRAHQVAPRGPSIEHSPSRPVEPEVHRQEPAQSMPPGSQQPAGAIEVRANVRSTETHVLEFHVPEHGNDPLHVIVHGHVEVGDVVSATWRSKPIRLQVRRPLMSTSHRVTAPRWLAVFIESTKPSVVYSP